MSDQGCPETKTVERDRALSAAYVAVAATAVLAAAIAFVASGGRLALGAAAGGVLAVGNLWVVERLVRAMLGGASGAWALLEVAKMAAICAAVVLLVRSGLADLLAILLGYGALPFGVLAAGLSGPARHRGVV